MSIYDFTLKNSRGELIPLTNFKDQVLLVVNTARYSPAYKPEQLEAEIEKLL